MQEVEVRAAPLEKLGAYLTPEASADLVATAVRARKLLAGRVVWNINATARGGGVAELLQALLAYGRGADVDTRWLVLNGDPTFFTITKRLHNALHGSSGEAGFGAPEREHYEQVLAENLAAVAELVAPRDIVLLHDPQTAGLVDGIRATGARVVWRCHIGRDESNANTERGWQFLRPYIENADAFVFSRAQYVPDWLPADRVRVIPPSIDPFAAKNHEFADTEVRLMLRRAGVISDGNEVEPIRFTRRDGTAGVLRRHKDLLLGTSPPPIDTPLVVQVSRWDRLKDMTGVLRAFADDVAPAVPDAQLMLVGPDVFGVDDDPEGLEVLSECRAAWARLPDEVAARCHLVCLPMDDIDENAIIVNGIQRHAAIVVQKSLVEGFGLTVTEAMWKGRPVLASAVGGIRDQIVDGVDGMLLPDPYDLTDFAHRLIGLLEDRALAEQIGAAAHERVRADFLGNGHLIRWVNLFADLIA
jgi:trehalose synthase